MTERESSAPAGIRGGLGTHSQLVQPAAVWRLGLLATFIIFLGSFGGGSVQKRNSILAALNLEFLSFGHGAALSNVTLWLGTIAYVVVWVLLGKLVIARAVTSRFVQRTLAVWLIPLAFAAPIMSRDVYSYLMQGTLLRDGFDAYTQGPAANPNQILFEVSHDWRNTTTPYGPLHLWISQAVTSVTGDNVTAGVYAFKAISLLGFAAIMWSIPKIAVSLGTNPAIALWLGVANPVMVFHLVGGIHNESIMVGLVSVGLYLIVRDRSYPALYSGFFAGVAFIAVGMALKATAAFCLPFVVWIVVIAAPDGLKHKLTAFFIAALGGAIETIAVLAIITYLSGASWGWIAALTGNSKVINPLSFPSLVSGIIGEAGRISNDLFNYNSVVATARSLSFVVMAVGFVSCWWWLRNRPITGAMIAYLVAFTFNAVTLPWYYASVLPLAGVISSSRLIKQLFVIGSIVVALAFTGSGNHQLYNPVWVAASLVAGWVAASWLFTPTHIKD
ncbi:carotene biosynthesis associated membrane protein [Corynebacterium mustelae]|uniref:Alpha-(1->6)-mannopyranosyltransferase A n=1 Tax=Corynebacterium mustelae TaxID=571915 RepID=A0A0G3GZA7_9CORY|nr:alpha-(1->6)-mannopyranosyltransferase A [Corynebacterium mustelae]AKK06501.1 carotene biosynthesis associated membrane protein [Corynebacterium mustelae]